MALGARAILIENVPAVQNAHGDVVRVAETLLPMQATTSALPCCAPSAWERHRQGHDSSCSPSPPTRWQMQLPSTGFDTLRQLERRRHSRLFGRSGISSIESRTPSSTARRCPPRPIADGLHGYWRMTRTIFLGTSARTVIVTAPATPLYMDGCTVIGLRRRSRQASALQAKAVSSTPTGRV
jgi:hypothetical protein